MDQLPPAAPASSGSPFLRVEVLKQGEAVRIEPRGELDMSNADALRAVLISQHLPGRNVLLDLSGLDFMDSTGIQVLLEADAAARANGHSMTVGSLSPAVRRVLEISGVLERLPFADGPEVMDWEGLSASAGEAPLMTTTSARSAGGRVSPR
jgi:stage II sporulation protein AA (anti-sigma F factor antagonist)